MKIAAIQMTTTTSLEGNLAEAKAGIAKAKSLGAQMAVLPEYFAYMGHELGSAVDYCEDFGAGRLQDFLSAEAKANDLWLIGGTIPLTSPDPKKLASACLVYDNQGAFLARYDKMHLFDVVVGDKQGSYCESSYTYVGSEPVAVNTPWGKMGLGVCYDVRFPELFRHEITKDMDFLVLPAAFTAKTGAAHWHTLLKARAIENLCYVIACDQGGVHENGFHTYGHSMILSPWGDILAEAAESPEVIIAELDFNQQADIREKLPALVHRKL